jgi:hypothetical protein
MTITFTQQAVKSGRFCLCLTGTAVIGKVVSESLNKLQLLRPGSRYSLTVLDALLAGSGLLSICVYATLIKHLVLTSLSRKRYLILLE